ncbi:hypothetical protein GCM10011584_33640 [Nocardioides phosphati]|uniref:DUF4393 domain-containing protein n=1 Tax=Nocardioides phosphati TaxID=1867775 RepID=A0ABQ2NDJ2_9ACTN|nr:hypothetical protein [Nocardioides phosphati]GGO93894.1 hypothetical protein GCM10011584_33640 [Nocardioides phosphati]
MGIFDQVAGAVRAMPGGAFPAQLIEQVGRIAAAAEQAALRALADRLLSAASTRLDVPALPAPATRAVTPARPRAAGTPETPAALLDDLLARAMRGSTETGDEDYHRKLLRQLVPDEARIFASLAAGRPSPTVSVYRRGNGDPVLRYASLIGRTAAVTVPSRTPAYLAHLLHVGLAELGPEDPEQAAGYELVLAERAVRDALREGQLGKVPAKVVRGTIRLSPVGRELWDVARPEGS